MRTRIERVPVDAQLQYRLDDLKALRAEGWDVMALLAPDQKTVVLLALRDEGSGSASASSR